MTTFWKNLNRLSQDQLFTRGYLAPATAAEIAAQRQAQDASECKSRTDEKRHGNSPWPRLAAFR